MKPATPRRTPGQACPSDHRHVPAKPRGDVPRPHSNPGARTGARLCIALALALGSLSCGDRATGPVPDQTIRITDSNFIPGDIVLENGALVEWQNASRERRTVTSGLDVDDPESGLEFDVELAGYRQGEPIGGTFRRRFTEIDTIYYYSRLVPTDFVGSFAGRIIIR